jgi:hypothetical protein
MNKFEWTVQPVEAGSVQRFAHDLQETLNTVEGSGYEVDDIMDAPGGREHGGIVIGKKPRPLGS